MVFVCKERCTQTLQQLVMTAKMGGGRAGDEGGRKL